MHNPWIARFVGLLLIVMAITPPVWAANTYGPTTANETLWSIASRTRPTYEVSTQQMMLAIRVKNPHAFTTTNINALRKGVVLNLPSLAEIQRIGRVQALHSTRKHNRAWYCCTTNPSKTATNPKRRVSKAGVNAARATQQRLKHEITALKAQLKAEQQRGEQLSAKIRQLQTTTAGNPIPNAPELEKIRQQMTELKTVLAEKDNHIKNLQTSLREASDSIKRQYAENQILYDKLKASAPDSLPTAPTAPGSKPQLTLTEAPTSTPTPPQTKPGQAAVFTDQLPPAANGQGSNTPPNSLQNLLEQQTANKQPTQVTPSNAADTPTAIPDGNPSKLGNGTTPSRISLIIALISLLFILALLWRAFNQRQALQRELNAGQTNARHHPATDNRKEPDILL